LGTPKPTSPLQRHPAQHPQYCQAAMTLYEQWDRLPPDAQAALYGRPLESILDLPEPQLQQWIHNGYKYFNQQVKAAKQQAKLQTADIHTLF